MATLPSATTYWRVKGAGDSAWTLDADGTFTPTAGATVEVVTVGPSSIAEIVADTIPAISGLADLSVSYGASVTINCALKSSGSNLVYSLTGPSWLSINSATGSITGAAPSADVSTTATVTVSNSVGSASDTFAVTVAEVTMIGGVEIGSVGAVGTYLADYMLVDGDDFDNVSSADFLTPTNASGRYMTTRNYGAGSSAPRYLRGASNLGGYEADPWHTGFADANRGVVPASFANTITFADSAVKLKSRRATTEEKAIMGSLNGKKNLSSMIHTGRRNMQRAPCMVEMRLRFPMALASWNQWHPTFWLIQSQPGNCFDSIELDCEGFSPELSFYRHMWTNAVAQHGSLAGQTSAVSETEYRTYSFEVAQVAGVWRVRLWENGVMVGDSTANRGADFDPTRPFILLMTNHILQSGLTQSIFDAAGDDGADIECDWWRVWKPSGTGVFRQPLVAPATYMADFNAPFSFALPTPAEVWGAGATSDVIEMIPNEDNSPAAPWTRYLLPDSVTRTGNTLAGTISDYPGRLVLARSYTPATGDGCIPQPITIAIGPRITLTNKSFTPGQSVSLDVYAACDCGDLHMGKAITVSGLSGSGLTYNATTGLLTGTIASGSYSVEISVTNSLGQVASKTVSVTASSAATAPGQVTGLTATAGNAQVALAWTAPSDGGSAISDYQVEVNSGSGWSTVSDGTSTATSYTHTGLANGTAYTYRVSAINAIGTGTASATASATPAAPVVGVFLSDTFSGETSSVLLSAHTGEIGATWARHPTTTVSTVSVTAEGDARPHQDGSNSSSIYYASGVPGSADYEVKGSLYFHTYIDAVVGLVGRLDTTDATFYMARLSQNPTVKELQLYKSVAGTLTKLGGYAFVATIGQTYDVSLKMQGSTISALIDGVSLISVTDTTISTPGRAGIRSYLFSEGSYGGGCRLNAISAITL